ncbi:MAG: signal peptidase II [Acidobacteriaceae bacterium]|jgi:signal peptidase II|nr:signal peptidase II [Acidobacteriaceae bacterium]
MTNLRRLDITLPLVAVVLDQVTKLLIRQRLAISESMTVIPGVLDFTHVRNSGVAYGFLNGVDFPYKSLLIAGVATVALVSIALYAKGIAGEQLLARAGLALIIGGAAGNLIDRLTTGSVVDFIDAYWRGWHFWAFNVADSAITIGVALMLLDIVGVRTHVSKTV